MDHKSFVASLPASRLAALSQTADAPGLRHLAGHLGAIVLLALWVARGWLLWPLAMIGLGICLCFLFTLQHETTHKTPFRTLWLNEWVGRITGLVILQPFEWFRYFHLAHHRHTNIPGKDPELLSGAKPETRAAMIWHVTGLPTWWGLIGVVVGNALGRAPAPYIPARALPRIRSEARWMLCAYALAGLSLTLTPLLLWVWILPLLLGQPFLRLHLLAEHGRCAYVADMLINTRTTLTNRLVRFVAWNMPYHTEHHTLPNVPFHQLPALHQDMKGQHGVLCDGYRQFTQEYVSDLH